MSYVYDVCCPYCGTVNRKRADGGNWGGYQLLTCDIDEGGCDQVFAVNVRIGVIVGGVYKLEKASVTPASKRVEPEAA